MAGGGTYNGTATHCVEVDWPSAYTWSARQYRRGYSGPSAWMGSLIFESRDASGLYYRRNRYYDSEKSRFTQEDPIGLAGGINVYGFANGDPIAYSDPYGLCPEPMRDKNGNCPGGLRVREWQQVEATYSNMSLEARARTRGLLHAGRIHGAALAPGVAGEVNPAAPGDVNINRSLPTGSIFDNQHELGKTLVHEGRHTVQLKGKAAGEEAANYILMNKDRLEADAYNYENRNYDSRGMNTARSDGAAWVNRQP